MVQYDNDIDYRLYMVGVRLLLHRCRGLTEARLACSSQVCRGYLAKALTAPWLDERPEVQLARRVPTHFQAGLVISPAGF